MIANPKRGARVVVTDGSAKGKAGVILGRSSIAWSPTVPSFHVELPDGPAIIRADYLDVAA